MARNFISKLFVLSLNFSPFNRRKIFQSFSRRIFHVFGQWDMNKWKNHFSILLHHDYGKFQRTWSWCGWLACLEALQDIVDWKWIEIYLQAKWFQIWDFFFHHTSPPSWWSSSSHISHNLNKRCGKNISLISEWWWWWWECWSIL